MIEITLKDPGMHDKQVQVRTFAEVGDVLEKHNRSYTTAVVRNTEAGGSHVKVYIRRVGEREWR